MRVGKAEEEEKRGTKKTTKEKGRKAVTEEKDERHGKKTKGRRRGKIRENEHGREALNKKYAKHARVSRLALSLLCYRRGEDEKSVELTFIGKLQAAAFGTE